MTSVSYVATPKAPTPKASFSQAVWAGPALYTAGVSPHDPETGEIIGTTIEVQTDQVLRNLLAILNEAGLSESDVVKATVHLHNLKADFPGFDAIYQKYFTRPYPVRTTVGSDLPGFLVEVDVVAFKTPAS